MSRLRKREGKGIGLRRLSSRVEAARIMVTSKLSKVAQLFHIELFLDLCQEFIEPDDDAFKREKPPKIEQLPTESEQ